MYVLHQVVVLVPIYCISFYLFTRPQDESDDRIQETLLVGYECKESTHPPGGNI